MPKAVKLSELERRALEIISERIDDGILQSELWKILGTDSREGSRIAIRLEKKGFITREPIVHESKHTYRLKLIKKEPKKISIASVGKIPCFSCSLLGKCGQGNDDINPMTCSKLSNWIMKEVGEYS
ncbi:MAG: hypothetical protein NZ926_02495 [Candidatus Methanomethylicia archaeon]|nr:hypothetical protein [Candidatus Methanomethylicia archaeon]MCX8169217.1 hypothetical protein [Candidatus Methanomethylicia archaeon]MDW7989001.1 hypothetical protein [Nitrososphaerota archaeon]